MFFIVLSAVVRALLRVLRVLCAVLRITVCISSVVFGVLCAYCCVQLFIALVADEEFIDEECITQLTQQHSTDTTALN